MLRAIQHCPEEYHNRRRPPLGHLRQGTGRKGKKTILLLMRRSLSTLALLLLTIPIGLAVRLLPLHLPWFLYKYLGSTLWAIALYWFLAALLPKLRPQALAALATIIATLLELSRLIPIAPIDAFRLTFAGKILLGRYFSLKNIAAYLLAITLTATLDRFFIAARTQPAG
jgi:hypothetical protein